MNRLSLIEAKQKLRIDKDTLDEDIIEQSVIYYEVSQNLVEAKQEKDKSKNALEIFEADTANYIRKHAKEKLTDKRVKELVLIDEDFVDYKNKYITNCMVLSDWEAMKEAYTQRSYMLRELARLWGANYYGDLSISGNKETKDSIAESARRKQSESRIKRRKLNIQ